MDVTYEKRWHLLIAAAESPEALDWIKANAERKGMATPEFMQLWRERMRELDIHWSKRP